MHETIIHNFLTLLECGAFHKQEHMQLQPMSPHKWRTLAKVADNLNVLPYICIASREMEGDKNLSTTLPECLKAYSSEKTELRKFDVSGAHLFNILTQRKFEEVREEEMNSQELSEETLVLLDIIISNADAIITDDVKIDGIIALGTYLRENHKNIDFNKLQSWLSTIGLVQIASCEANMLIECMHFTREEIPFARKRMKKAKKLFMNPILKVFTKHHFSNATRLDIAMLETISHRFMSAISMITDIEE